MTLPVAFLCCLLVSIAGAPVAYAGVTGTAPNLSGSTEIYDNTVWQGEYLVLNATVTIHPGGSLLLDNTFVAFASTAGDYYGIEVKAGTASLPQGGRLLVVNGSTVTAQNPACNTYVYAESSYPFPARAPVIQAKDSFFSELGKGQYGYISTTTEPARRYGLEMRHATAESYFDHVTVSNSYNGIYLASEAEPVEIKNCSFENIAWGAVLCLRSPGPNIHDNRFTNFHIGIYTDGTDGLRVVNNYFDPGSQNDGNYVVDIWGTDDNFVVAGNTITNFQKGIILNGLVDTSEGPHHGVIEDNVLQHGGGAGIGMNCGAGNITIRNNSFDDVREPVMCSIPYGINFSSWTIENNTILNSRAHAINLNNLRGAAIGNNTLVNAASGYGFKVVPSDKGVLSDTVTVYNTTLSNFRNAVYLQGLHNGMFRDVAITSSAVHDIEFYGNTANIKFINVRYDPGKVYFDNTDDAFLPYYYLDVMVEDINGASVPGAGVTVASDVSNVLYPSINCRGEALSSAVTDAQGKTPLPSDAAHSLAVLDYTQSSAAVTAMTYTLTAEKNGVRAIVSDITPDAGWYRENPEAPVTTVVITLPLSLQAINAIGTVLVCPNPYIKGKSTGKNVVFSNLPKESTLRLYTMAGTPLTTFRHTVSFDGGSEEWDVSGVPGGIYLYTISSSRGITRGKVSVVK